MRQETNQRRHPVITKKSVFNLLCALHLWHVDLDTAISATAEARVKRYKILAVEHSQSTGTCNF
jgi:hypothetical protein